MISTSFRQQPFKLYVIIRILQMKEKFREAE